MNNSYLSIIEKIISSDFKSLEFKIESNVIRVYVHKVDSRNQELVGFIGNDKHSLDVFELSFYDAIHKCNNLSNDEEFYVNMFLLASESIHMNPLNKSASIQINKMCR